MIALLRRDLRLAFRHAADTLAAVMFFALAAALFPLALGPGEAVLGRVAPAIVWVTALLAALLPLDRLVAADWEDGSLDLALTAGVPPAAIATAKALAHWLATGLPLLLAAGPVALMLRADTDAVIALLAGLALGTPVLSLLGTLGAALAAGARRAALLLPLLVLPLAVPVLVFGVAAADPAGDAAGPSLMLLGALLAAALSLAPLAAGAALRAAAE
jgi:heme exporter protein B